MSVTNPLLKDLKKYILALSQPVNSYAIPLNSRPSPGSSWTVDHEAVTSITPGLGEGNVRGHYDSAAPSAPQSPAIASSKVTSRCEDTRDSLSSSPECQLTLNRLSFEPCSHWSAEPSELTHHQSQSVGACKLSTPKTLPSDHQCLLSPTPCTSHPLSPVSDDPIAGNTSPISMTKCPAIPHNQELSPARICSTNVTTLIDTTARVVLPSIADSHPSLAAMCETLEAILNDGLQEGISTPFGYHKISYWQWMCQIKEKCVGKFPRAIDEVLQFSSLRGSKARGRLLIRYCLQYGCLQVPIITKMKQDSFPTYYSSGSILGHEILSEIFLSLVRQLDTLTFDLNLSNWAFLDCSWHLPATCCVDLNPCVGLGMHLGHVAGRSVVMRVELNGAAHRSGLIHTGDVIYAINGKVIHGFNRQNVSQLLKEAKTSSASIRLKIAKGLDMHGRVYPPVLSLLIKLGVDLEDAREMRIVEEENRSASAELLQSQISSKSSVCDSPISGKPKFQSGRDNGSSITTSPCRSSTVEACDRSYRAIDAKPCDDLPSVWLVGSVEVGNRGDVELISDAILTVLRTCETRQHIPVNFNTGEIGVKVLSLKGKTLLQHSYTEISACGRRESHPHYFAYLAGDTTCSLSAQFTCFVFRAATVEECSEILLTLADGFHRTHWAV
ncbi:uncharacterized protein LOC108681201 [Hyalella azteca]|uniref:Uncharacterized protein LOC108681201 n=1 Tax=Hyalella azteca TaxID=294128 RepID=A0A8B7PJZ5_HYAAZ|nr:uncharacterized protein LOC108681201 [Hyalella azteca]